MRGNRAVAAVTLTAALTSCVFGGSGKAKPSSNSIGDRNLAVPAQSIPGESTTTSSAASTEGSTTPTSDASGGAGSTGGRIVAIADPANDAGASAPAYADAVEVTVDDDGVNARVRVRMRSTVPLALADREVMGVGVNINDAQLFADGESDGWYAYLQIGERFLTYPGTFQISDDTLIFTVPWNVIGDPHSGNVDGFVDWSKPRLLGTEADTSSDRVPDSGSATFTR